MARGQIEADGHGWALMDPVYAKRSINCQYHIAGPRKQMFVTLFLHFYAALHMEQVKLIFDASGSIYKTAESTDRSSNRWAV
jgi:hypothetical protein